MWNIWTNSQNDNYFPSKWQFFHLSRTISSKNSCHFVNLIRIAERVTQQWLLSQLDSGLTIWVRLESQTHRKTRPLVKFNLRQITKHLAKVSFWTTWLEVSRRVRVCKILTSSMPDSISIHSVSVTYLAPLNKYRLEIGCKFWLF